MLKYIGRALLGFTLTPLLVICCSIGFPLIALLALYMQWRWKYTSHVDVHLRPLGSRYSPTHFPRPFGLPLFWLWDNDEDGVDGDPWGEPGDEPKNIRWFEQTANWPYWRKVFIWSAVSYPVYNFHRLLDHIMRWEP